MGEPVEFGHLLRELRRERGFSLARLSQQVHYSKGYLSRVENLERAPTSGLARACDRAFGGTDGALEQALRDARRRPAAGGTAKRSVSHPVPRQLPADPRHFTGRDGELRVLTELARAAAGERSPTVVATVGGAAGIGKTALAVHFAHQVADAFPDGHLYVNLRGFDPNGSPLAPAEAVRGFLDALAVPDFNLPADPGAQVLLYRSLLAGRRMLVVLDNARDAAQARPLLPGAPGCLVLVTSRDRLAGLIVAEGAQPLTLGLLSRQESRLLLARRLTAERVEHELDHADELIDLCARLPLALSICAGNAAAHPGLGLGDLARILGSARSRLDALATQDITTDLRAVFSCSYHLLSPPAARMFRLLALHPGPECSAAAAANLAGVRMDDAHDALDEMVRAHLLSEPTLGRFAFHDLLRAYAAECATSGESGESLDGAIRRMLGYYLHAADHATRLLNPAWDPLPHPAPPQADVEGIADHEQALAWLDTEHPTLLAVVGHAVDRGFDTQAWQLGYTLLTYLDRRVHWRELDEVGRLALTAGERLGDANAQACAHRAIARARLRLGSIDEARGHLDRALALHRDPADRSGLAYTHRDLALVCEQLLDYPEALRHAERTLALLAADEQPVAFANALNTVGWFHTLLSDHDAAERYCREALAIQRRTGNLPGEAGTWDSLGHISFQLGKYGDAVDCYQRAVELFLRLSDEYYQAGSLVRLGDAQAAAGDPEAARASWSGALAILKSLQHPDAEWVPERLARRDPSD